ncbi:TIGR00366 family protein [Cesiribacter andamanensis]|uniref:Short-chain fatty acids transporter n=1 Tax=Cesiribacter andamanensis AMV16 TaxID=1279009 RepID=M7N4R0_9BACT|nr:TIGR00366 family protein [Cesiribacter andamanensis]EMR03653.1 Short-chain fatty acids transporter [Cesiribacter andamanensis AMV16]
MPLSTFGEYFRKALPSPFTIALLLTVVAFMLPVLLLPQTPSLLQVAGYWHKGFWELLGFSMQMVLILVLGHTLALTAQAQRFIDRLTRLATSPGKAAAFCGAAALLTGFLNWGLCLIFGAILARKLAESARARGLALNYPLVAAAGYSGMMVWHGGLSGSAPLVVAGEGHFLADQIGIVPVRQTLFSGFNLAVTASLLLVVPLGLYLLGRRAAPTPELLPPVGGPVLTATAEQTPQGRATGQ